MFRNLCREQKNRTEGRLGSNGWPIPVHDGVDQQAVGVDIQDTSRCAAPLAVLSLPGEPRFLVPITCYLRNDAAVIPRTAIMESSQLPLAPQVQAKETR